jgi:cytochrome c oxidase subunit 2
MNPGQFPILLWPPAASAIAQETDWLILAWTGLAVLLIAPVFVGMTWFAFHYRAGKNVNRTAREGHNRLLELGWMVIPFTLTLIFFAWGVRVFDEDWHAPAGAIEIHAIGRQWMWKFQHPGGQAEINDLHVPLGQPVVISEISQDVIHSLYIPAMRVQMETLPDRYTQLWFKANRPGVYRMYCSEYCGTDHSNMDGLLYVMTPAEYEAWLAHAGTDVSLAAEGKALFSSYGCAGCHLPGATVRAPSLAGLFGNPVPMADGGTVVADDSYIRDKILDPDTRKVAGYKQVMPNYKGQIPEDELVKLIAYIKSLGAADAGPNGEPTP